MKHCSYCGEDINEDRERWCMNITKQGNRIIEFEAFHLNCWKLFFEGAVERAVREKGL